MKNYYKLLLFCVSFFAFFQAEAGYCFSLGNGNFEDSTTWSCGRVPGSGDTILISVGDTVRVTSPHTGLTGVWLQVYGCMDFNNACRVVFEYGDTSIPASMVTFYTGSSCINGNGSSGLSFGSGGSGCDVYRPAQGANPGVYPTIPGSYYDGCVWASYLSIDGLTINVELKEDLVAFDWSLKEPDHIKAYELLGIKGKEVISLTSLDARNNGIEEYYSLLFPIENYDVFVLNAIHTDETRTQMAVADISHLLANTHFVSPNPFQDKLVVSNNQAFTVKLSGMDGQIHYEMSGINYYSIPTSDLVPGVYFLISMKDDQIIEQRKLVKF